jgi:RNA polymerase sigma-70 factor (ECF subfamily)
MATATSQPVEAGRPTFRDAPVDVDLVDRMRAGDEQALASFYDRWFPMVHGVVARMLESSDDVEDVVEDTFWQVWRQAGRFAHERGSVQTWVLTIARSRALDRLRAVRRLREEPMDADAADALTQSAADHPGLESSDPLRETEHRERRRLVLAALGALPGEQRQALELGYFGGLSQTEIAERTGQPLGTVKTRMRLAMQKLRERLAVLSEGTP